MSDLARDGRVLWICGRAGMRNQLSGMLEQLQRCQRCLNEYLEQKRDAFPRFYFIGDDDLLEILGQVSFALVRSLFASDHFSPEGGKQFSKTFFFVNVPQ